VVGALAPDARFLHATERRAFGIDEACVGGDDAVFQRFGHAPDAAMEAGRETEFRIVGQRDTRDQYVPG
jgi:hypothetical protein